MARKIAVEIVGDSRQLTRAFSTSTRSAKKFNSEITHMGRGAAAGSGLFRSLGRSVAFASGGFLAFAGVTDFLRTSVDAARDAAVAQRALAAQMKASGESFREHRAQIEKTTHSYGRFGFQNEQVVASLTVLERGTGSINKAIGLQGLAADLARAKNIDLAAAAQTVAKVFGGQETALRRAVPGLNKNAHGWDLIREAQQRLAGQAAAGTTTAERFAATLHNTQEIIGTALLPVLNTYLAKLSVWLDRMNRSGKLQKDVNQIARDTGAAFNVAAAGISAANAAAKAYNGTLGRLGAFFQFLPNQLRSFSGTTEKLLKAFGLLRGITGRVPAGARGPVGLGRVPAGALGPAGLGGTAAAAAAAKGPSSKLLNQWFDARIGRMTDRVQDAPLRGQLTRLRKIAALLSQRIAITKDITRKLDLEDKLVGIRRQTKAVREQLQQQIADARAEQLARAQEARQRALAATAARQFRRLGFGPTGEDLIPGVKTLRGQLDSVRKAVEGSFLDTRKTRGLLGHIRQVLSGGLGAVGSEVRSKIQQILADLKAQLKQASGTDVTKFQQANSGRILAALGINLPRAQRRRLELALAGIGSGGRAPAFSGQFGGAGALNIYGGLHLHGVQNVAELEAALAKRAKQRAQMRRSTR